MRAWYRPDYQEPVLHRAALIAAARKGDWTRLPDMLDYLSSPGSEEVQTVSLVRLLANASAAEKWPVLRKLMEAPSPWVRSSAAEILGERLDPPNVAALLVATRDDYRLVRIRSASALQAISPDNLPPAERPQVALATSEFLDSMRSRPDDMGSHYNLGNYHLARHQMKEAVAEFETAIRLEPDVLPPYVNAAIAHSALGEGDKAEARLRQALQLDPTNATALLNLGMLSAEKGKLSEAQQAFRAAFAANSHSAQAAYNLAVLLSNDHPDEAVIWARKAADLDPDNPRNDYTYAYCLERAGLSGQALLAIRSALRRHPDHEDSVRLERALLQETGQSK